MSSVPTGRCAAGPDCLNPNYELQPGTVCLRCDRIVHILCGDLDSDMKFVCSVNCSGEKEKSREFQPVLPPIPAPYLPTILEDMVCVPTGTGTTTASTKPTRDPQHKTKSCNACGGTDHVRRSSKKCRAYTGGVKGPKKVTGFGAADVDNNTNLACSSSNTKLNSIKDVVKQTLNFLVDKVVLNIAGYDVVSVEEVKDDENEGGVVDAGCVESYPKFICVGNEIELKKSYKPVIDIYNPAFKFTKTVLKLISKDYRNRTSFLSPTPAVLVDKYFPVSLIERFVNHSNAYVQECKRREPHLEIWKRKTDARPFMKSCIYQFIAIIYYMGIVKLPSKDDYWSTHPMMPTHVLCNQCGMTRNRFRFLWRYFHTNHPIEDDYESEATETRHDNDGLMVEQVMERVQIEQEGNDNDNDHDTETVPVPPPSDKVAVWFEKLEPLISHFRGVSEDLIFILGTTLALDEMMIRFMGRSAETHRMKNKPISEGFKFFVLATSNGFIVNFTPDGRSAAKNNTLEYAEDKSVGKIESMTMFVVSIIERLKEKQQKRIRSNYSRVLTRGNDVSSFDESLEVPQDKFIIAMDNYFTLPGVIARLRGMNIGVVGTGRFRRNWPPKILRDVSADNADFNDFYWTVDEHGTLLGRWMDNGMVFVTSTIHQIGKIIKRNRKKPRKTPNNKKHVDKIWGDKGAVPIYIPAIIDDYNHWMGGVDLSDQRISYYHPDLRCFRTWMPMFIQILSMIRNNSYITHKQHDEQKAMKHKEFTLDFIDELMKRSINYYFQDVQQGIITATPAGNISIEDMSAMSSISALSNFTTTNNASIIHSTSSHASVASSRRSLQHPKHKSKSSTFTYSSKRDPSNNHSISSSKRKNASTSSALLLPPAKKKRSKVKNQSITLKDYDYIRLQPPLKNHTRTINTFDSKHTSNSSNVNSSKNTKKKQQRQACIYCSLKFDEMKKNSKSKEEKDALRWDKHVKRTVYQCSICQVYLCNTHFELFHTDTVMDEYGSDSDN